MNNVTLAIVVATAVVAIALGRYTFSRIDRFTVPWSVAWLKTLVIVVAITALVVLIPGWVMTLDVVASADPLVADLIGTAVFSVGLLASLWMLWRAQRDSRI